MHDTCQVVGLSLVPFLTPGLTGRKMTGRYWACESALGSQGLTKHADAGSQVLQEMPKVFSV